MENFKTAKQSRLSITELMLPSHSNFGGKVHGGYILNLMDQIAFACASKHSQSYCVTASVNRVDFLSPVEVGELVTLKASVNYTGNTSMVIGVRVEAENVTTGKKRHCNSSYFTMVAKDQDGSSTAVPGLLIEDKHGLRRFARSKNRKEEAFRRDTQFDETKFEPGEEHFELMKKENIKIEFK
ncbi:MAG: acyl-CoA thioesterase [Aurantibacter sp.]